MWRDGSLQIRLYFWAIFLFVLGTTAGYHGFFYLGILLWVLGGTIAVHIILVSIIRERRSYIDAQTEKLDKQLEFYKHIQAMTPEEKYLFGLTYVPPEVTVKVDKTAREGNEFSQTWKKLPIAPYKLKVIAQATINGEGFTIRKWVGDKDHPGLLTRTEWDALHNEMEELKMLEKIGEDPREGFTWTSFGEDVMTQVAKDML